MKRAFLFTVVFILLFTVFLLLAVFYLNVLQMGELNLAQTRNITRIIYAKDDITTDLLSYLELSVRIESNSTHTILNISDSLTSPYSDPVEVLSDYKSFINGIYSNQTNLLNSTTNLSAISLNTTGFESAPSLRFINSNSSLDLLYSYNNLSKNELIINGSNLLRNYSIAMRLNNTCLNNNCANATWAGGPPNNDSSTVGMWHFDDGSGGTAADSSGNGNTGTLAPAGSLPAWVGGRFGYALSFDGSNSYVNVSDADSLKPANITVEAWVKPNSYSNWATILMKSTSDSWADGYGLAHYTGANDINFFINDYNSNKASGTLDTGRWSHIAGTYNGSHISLYINGVLAQSVEYSTPISHSSQPLKIGKGAGGSAYMWNGLIDEVAVYNRSKSAEEIAADANLFHWDWGPIAIDNQTLSAWHLDESTGTTAMDSSGNGNNGTISGAAWNSSGKSGYALTFGGSGYVEIPDSSTYHNISDEITIEAWVNLNSNKNYNAIVVKDVDSSEDFEIMCDSGGDCFSTFDGVTSRFYKVVDANLQPGVWTHIAVTYKKNGDWVFYKNGIAIDNTTHTDSLKITNGATLRIGDEGGTSGRNFDGTIDEVAVYNRSKSADEIAADANPLYVALDIRDAINSSVTIRNAAQGYINPGANSTFYLKTSGNGDLNMTAGDYSGFYSLRAKLDNTNADLLLKTIQEGVSDIQAIIPIELQVYQQVFHNLVVAEK